MKRLIYFLVILTSLVSCSSKEENIDRDKEFYGERTSYNSKLSGKWRVKYSKQVTNAIYDPSTGEMVDGWKGNTSTTTEWHLGDVGMPATVFEYDAEYIEIYQEEIKIYYLGLNASHSLWYEYEGFRETAFYCVHLHKPLTIKYYFEDNSTLVLILADDPNAGNKKRYVMNRLVKRY